MRKTARQTMAWVVTTLSLSICSAATADEDSVPASVASYAISAPVAAQIALEAERNCKAKGFQVAVAVVDRFGNLIAFLRDPLAGTHTITIAKNKAYTAASFQGATLDLADRLSFLSGIPELTRVGGGVPIQIGGRMYAAVGVSGAPREKIPGDVDDACARAGIAPVQETLEFVEEYLPSSQKPVHCENGVSRVAAWKG